MKGAKMQHDLNDDDTLGEIRQAVAKLCAQFPGTYWRQLDRDAAYPTEFVQALTAAGYLAALIPEAYGGAGLSLSAAAAILEEIQRAGAKGAAGRPVRTTRPPDATASGTC